MGGKTQPRVAGNIKPSSSGRIRELLTNTQGGAGNIITFSALSNNQQAPVIKTVKNKSPKNEEAKAETPQTNDPQIHGSPEAVQSPSSFKTGLVKRTIGGRDYFMRVKVNESGKIENLQDEVAQNICLVTGKTGIIKPPEPSFDDYKNESEGKLSDDHYPTEGDECSLDSLNDEDESDIDDDANAQDFDAIVDRLAQVTLKDENEGESSKSLDDVTGVILEKEHEKMKLFRLLVRNHSQDLSIEEWDILVNSINQWVCWISKVKFPIKDQEKSKFCTNVFRCLYQFLMLAKNSSTSEEEVGCARFILESWNDFHSSSVYKDLVRIYLNCISGSNELAHNDEQLSIIEAVAEIVIEVDPGWIMLNDDLLIKYLGGNKVEFDPDFQQPKNARYCIIDESKFNGFIAVCSFLRSNHRVILIPAHVMLSQTMSSICENIQSSSIMDELNDLDNALILPPPPLMAVLTSRDFMMSALLSDYKAGDISVTIEPNTDSYSCTLAYLFAWDLVIEFIVGVDKQLGHRIIHALKKLGLIQRLLDNVFMLLPPLGEKDSLNLKMPKSKQRRSQVHHWTLTEFLRAPLKTFIKRQINEIELVALHTYFSVASHMPVTVRKWFNNNSNKRLCNLVNEYTIKHISQVICTLEMDNVQHKCQERASLDESNNLVIKARPSAKEVYATYTRDEFRMELTIKLPNNYPLGPVQIDGGKRVGVTDLKWRSWLLQLTTFLSHQNGPILDGIDLWRRNIDKKFEGIEKCTICFSILHSNYQLPKKKCQTCTKMFHNLCLYKWFESSGNSTCPLCRNPW